MNLAQLIKLNRITGAPVIAAIATLPATLLLLACDSEPAPVNSEPTAVSPLPTTAPSPTATATQLPTSTPMPRVKVAATIPTNTRR